MVNGGQRRPQQFDSLPMRRPIWLRQSDCPPSANRAILTNL